MKLIHSLDISEGISMDSLKPSIINSGEDTSFESILGMKDASGDDCMINTDKHSQIHAQKDKPVTDIDGIGNNAKKMFEKVDLNSSLSSDISLKKDSWNSGTLYDKSSEKENIVDTNDVRFDILSDEDDSLHLKISSDEDTSLGDEVIQSTPTSREIYTKVDSCDLPVDNNFIGNDNSNERKTKLCSSKGDDGCSEHNTKEILCNNIDDSMEKESSETQELNASSGSDSIHANSVEELESTPSCSKTDCTTSVTPSKENDNLFLNDGEIHPYQDNGENREENHENSFEHGSEIAQDAFPTTTEDCDSDVDIAKNTLDILTDSEKKVVKVVIDDSIPNRICGKNFKDLDSFKVNNTLKNSLNTKLNNDSFSTFGIFNKNSLVDRREENDEQTSEKSIEFMVVDEVEECNEPEKKLSVEINQSNHESNEESENMPCNNTELSFVEDNHLHEGFGNQSPVKDVNNEDGVQETGVLDIADSSQSCAGSGEVQGNSSENIGKHKSFKSSVDRQEFEVISEKNSKRDSDDVLKGETKESKQECLFQTSSEDFLSSNSEATPGRKRTSCSSEKFNASSKRSKISASESEDCDVVLCNKTSDERGEKKMNAKTKDNSEVKENKLPITFDKIGVKSLKDSFELSVDKDVLKTDVSGAEDKKAPLKSKAVIDSKKELKSGHKYNPLPFLRNFSRAQLQSMTRNDLEELVLQKICEAITERSVCGELREIAVNLDQKLKSWQKKSLQLTKQVRDLSLVLKRYESDLQNKGPNVVPVKITRSVGLQVQMPGASHPVNWNQEDPHWRKGEKNHSTVPASTSSTKSPVKNVGPKNPTPSSPSVKLASSSSASQKVVENSKISAGTPTVPNSPSSSAKVLQTKSPITPTSNSSTNKTSQKQIIPSVNNRLKSASDLQVIDLTDAEDKTRTNVSVPTTPTSSTVTADSTTSVVSSVNSTAITTVGVRPIRVVPHPLSSTTTAPILSQTVTSAVTSQRVAYYVPTTVPQRQLILSNTPQVRPSGVVVSHRPNSIPAIVLKPGPVVPVSAVTASNAIIRTSNVSSAIQLGPNRSQPRPTHYLQRIPVSATPVQSTGFTSTPVSHPAPLPPIPPSGPSNANWKLPPPKPDLKISKVPNRNQQGIVLSWNMTVTTDYEEIASYQLFAYQEGTAPPSTNLWKKVGDVKALPLPMACTLTQFMEGHKYHFAVRAVDVYARYGPFSSPGNIVLTRN